MKNFNMKDYFEGKKLVTRGGQNVTVLSHDYDISKDKFSITCQVKFDNCGGITYVVDVKGKSHFMFPSNLDVFIDDSDEPKLMENNFIFNETFKQFSYCMNNEYGGYSKEINIELPNEEVKEESKIGINDQINPDLMKKKLSDW